MGHIHDTKVIMYLIYNENISMRVQFHEINEG